MLDESFNQAIKIIFQRLENTKIKWALIGSSNMAI